MSKASNQKQIGRLTTSVRVQLAKSCMSKVLEHVLHLIAVQESNNIVLYTNRLGAQVSNTHAGHAFNLTRECLFRYGVVKLCAVWETNNIRAQSISTVADLIDDQNIIAELSQETFGHWANESINLNDLDDDPEIARVTLQAHKDSNLQFAKQQANLATSELRAAVKEVRVILDSSELRSIRQLRNKHLAHSLFETYEEKSGPIPAMKYGQEKKLMQKTIDVTDKLYCWVNGTSFDFKSSIKMRKEQAESLWHGCKITPLK